MSTDSVILRLLRSILVNMGVVMIALLVALSVIEGSARIIKGRPLLLWMNFTEAHLDFLRQIQPGEYHPLLGWIPKENYAASNNYWGIRIETIRHGLRFTGDFDSSERDTILAVGDSFTFGDEVSDKDTWPFILNGQVKEYVLNGGVFGYGIDQTYLRLTELMKHYRLAIIIFSFTPEDIIRARMSKRHAQKPFFVVNRGEIELKKCSGSTKCPRNT